MKFYKHNIVVFLLLFSKMAVASHISGGELFYKYIGPGALPNTDEYRITVRLFRECNSTGQALNTESVTVGIFYTADNSLYTSLYLNKLWDGDPPVIQNTPGAIPCLTGDGSLCYQIGLFDSVIDLPKTAEGYTLSWVRCCRQQVTNVRNTPYPDSAQGSTFITHIAGTNVLPTGFNSSPEFVVKDTVLVCAGKPFKLDFSAFDPDNDSLAYTFCDAYSGATPGDPDPPPDDILSLAKLPYLYPYSGGEPLGKAVTINAQTGLITGVAPPTAGKYVVQVCVEEYRKGVLLNIHHKDFILKIADCDFASAQLNPSYLTCGGFGLQFENQSASAAIYSYFWDFGVPGATNDTSSQPQPFFNYPDSGTYKVKLVVNRRGSCGDSTTTLAEIYPGFAAKFGFVAPCLPAASVFTDSSSTRYGKVATWQWNFGDSTGTSNSQNPSYQYQGPGTRNVMLIVTNSKGCADSITRQVFVPGQPVITLPSADTSVCNLDTLRLSVSASPSSTFIWTPAINIINANSSSPIVFPIAQTTYTVFALDSNGCSNTASIVVNVLSLPTVSTIGDTAICNGSSITLSTTGTGTGYQWLPGIGISDSTSQSPVASPLFSTQYIVTAINTSGCLAKDTVNLIVHALPVVTVSPDSLICNGGSAQLAASSPVTVSYSWTPITGLNRPLTANPVASPTQTTTYKVAVTDSNACGSTDTVVITVIPKPVFSVTPSSKNICRGDSVVLTASGGEVYQWLPATNIYSDTSAATAVFPQNTITYTVAITSKTCNIVDSERAVVDVSPPFPLNITKSNDLDCFIGQATLHATGGTEYVWTPTATLSSPDIDDPVASPFETTTYYVTARNGTACVETDSIQLKLITDNVPNGYYMASAFTPNGDGHNDCFGVKDWGGIKAIQFSVYNRWGNLLYYSESPSGCWDGTYKGIAQAPGTYVYQVTASTVCGNVYRKGTIVLIR